MPTKLQIYSQMADHSAEWVTQGRERWTSFLDTAARLYKYPFPEQLMIFAQRPDAKACAPLETWNDPMNRWVKRGAKGIALIDTTSDKPRLKYVFDVSDTEDGRRNPRRPFLWELKQEHEAPVMEALANAYDSDAQGDLGNIIYEIAGRLAAEYYDDHRRDIEYSAEGSYLEDYDEFNIGVAYRDALTVSLAYTLMSRCGLDTTAYLEDEDFMPVFDFNTPDAVNALGTGVSQLSEQVLREIEVTIKNYERQKAAERSATHGQLDISPAWGLSDTQPDINNPVGRADREIRPPAPDVSERPPANIVQFPNSERETIPAPVGNQRDGQQEAGAAYDGADGAEPAPEQGSRSDGMGAAYERIETPSGRTDIDGADLQLSLFPTEQAQREAIAQADGGRLPEEQQSSAFSISDEEIDALLRQAVENPDSRQRIVGQFEASPRSREAAQVVKEEYSRLAFTMPRTDGEAGYIGLLGEDKGVAISKGSLARVPLSERPPAATLTLPWPKVQQRVARMIEAGEFLAANVPAQAAVAEPEAPAAPVEISQDDIDAAIIGWNGDPESKRRVYNYMCLHARERDTAAYLKEQYGGHPGLIVSKDGAEPVTVPWPKVQRRIAQLMDWGEFLPPVAAPELEQTHSPEQENQDAAPVPEAAQPEASGSPPPVFFVDWDTAQSDFDLSFYNDRDIVGYNKDGVEYAVGRSGSLTYITSTGAFWGSNTVPGNIYEQIDAYRNGDLTAEQVRENYLKILSPFTEQQESPAAETVLLPEPAMTPEPADAPEESLQPEAEQARFIVKTVTRVQQISSNPRIVDLPENTTVYGVYDMLTDRYIKTDDGVYVTFDTEPEAAAYAETLRMEKPAPEAPVASTQDTQDSAEPVQADVWYRVGDKVYYDDTEYEIIEINEKGGYISLLDANNRHHHESPEMFNALLLTNDRNQQLRSSREKPEPAAAPEPAPTPLLAIADYVKSKLEAGEKFTSNELFAVASKAYGDTMANNAFTSKDAYDAMELGVNQYILASDNVSSESMLAMLDLLPTQTRRTAEMEKFQQFSTPPSIAYLANWAANVGTNDIMLEPSAGNGGIAVFAKKDGAAVYVNELDKRRLEVIKNLPFDGFFNEDAEQINNIHGDKLAPTVIVMNPPFSSSAERNVHNTKIGAKHIEEALKMLAPNGRLVAVVGQGMAEDAPAFRAWWRRIKEQYNVKANIGIDGKNYNKYGTSFGIQMLVIDKDGPTIVPVKTAFVENLLDLQSILEGIRNDRPSIRIEHDNGAEQNPVAATRLDATAEREPERGQNDAVLDSGSGADTAAIGDRREQTGTSEIDTAVGRTPGVSPGLAGINDDGPTPILDAERHRGNEVRNDGANVIGRTDAADSGQSAGSVKPLIRQPKPVKTELTDSIFERYEPQPLLLENVQPHPANISESAAMSAIEPPPVTYKPSIGQDIVKNGVLSDVQLEAVSYAGQSHSQTLPGGNTRGFFLGDGTGVGKGRTITGVILDNYNQGRKKAVWLSENRGLVPDAKRDVKALFGNSDLVVEFQGGKKADASLSMNEGILFATYSALSKGFDQSGSNYEKIVNWLGKDFDGVIVFDEAHNMANSIATKGTRGVKKASQRGMAGLAIQEALPKAKIIYSSATGATEVENLRYAERLGLWGEGTAFPNGDDFVHKIKAGGLAAMELIARDMKAMGVYLSRNISYEDVVYDKIVHELTPQQRQIYDELARSWQIVFQNLNKALETTNQKLDGTAKGKAYGAFWSAEQRFFNQILTAMQVPSMITDMQKQLDNHNSIVIQLVSTNEAAQEREFARLQEQDLDLDDFDLTPKQMLMSYIENSFPTVQFEEYTDDNGNVRSKPVYDSEGNPVINREAVRQKEMLLDKLGSIKVPASALDMIINHFGSDMVAENTGRKRRVVVKDGKAREENISHKKEADVTAFQNGDKRIIVFSKAGGTGKSYHADKSAKNQQHRVHYLLQAGWQADAAVQGFGRSHRSNQVSAPTFALVTTDLKGQMRFISTIAKRLDQLGALTKGQRQTGSQGLFTAGDNLENAFAADVLALFYKTLIRGGVHGVPDGISIIEKLGLKDKLIDEYGQINTNAQELREVNKFLNRILSLESSEQNAVFDGYAERLQAATERALQDGTLDKGLENYRADKIVLKEAHDIRIDETTGATTKYYNLTAHHKIKPLRFNQVNTQHHSFVGFYQNENTGTVRAVFKTSSTTDEYGNVSDNYRLTGQDGNEYIPQYRLDNNWEPLTAEKAGELWNDAIKELPEFRTNNLHLIGGTVLPVWDKLPTENVRIYRVLTSDGELLIGRVIPESMIDATLHRLGATREKENIQTEDLLKGIKNGDTVYLDNGWRIMQKKVSNEQRLEIIGADYLHSDLLAKKGVFTERIAYQTRYFIPAEKDTIRILDEVLKISPVSRVENSNERAAAKSNPYEVEQKQPGRVSAKGKPSILADLRAAVASVKAAPPNNKTQNHQHDRG